MMFVPHPVVASKSDRALSWSVESGNSGWVFDTNGVFCNTNPPPPYTGWPADNQPVPQDRDPQGNVISYTAIAPIVDSAVMYQYTINLKNTITGALIHWDPDIENQPQP